MGASESAALEKIDSSALVTTFNGALSERYNILSVLGAGAQGRAYLVKEKDGKMRYVAKETHDMTEQGKAAFKVEFSKMAALRHPHCAKVIELVEGRDLIDGEWKDQIFIISELAPGGDLFKYTQQVVESGGRMTEEWISRVFLQAMKGVSYLHSNSIVHNDLKPDNILMLEAFDPSEPAKVPTVVINDFGCATLAQDKYFLCGDPRYQSAETWDILFKLLDGEEGLWLKVGPKADVWSMAATLFQLLSGGLFAFWYRPCDLHEIQNNMDLLKEMGNHVLHDALQIRPHCVDISDHAADLLESMFQKDPALRPSAADVQQHPWFSIRGKPVADQVQVRFEVSATKGFAHRILLNALATKIHRDHYKASWEIFDALDKDRSGLIGFDEFKEGLMKKKRAGSFCAETSCESTDDSDEQQAVKFFKQADIDGDEAIDFNEFLAATFDWKALSNSELEATLKSVFESLDKDNTDSIDEKEFASVLQGAIDPEDASDIFQWIDTNGDGVVTLDELTHYIVEPPNEEDAKRYEAKSILRKERRREDAKKKDEVVCGVYLPVAVCLVVCLCNTGIPSWLM